MGASDVDEGDYSVYVRHAFIVIYTTAVKYTPLLIIIDKTNAHF